MIPNSGRTARVVAAALLAVVAWSLPVAEAQSGRADQTKKYVQPGSLRPEFQVALEHFGSRLSVPGREALLLVGTIAHDGGAKAPFQASMEAPDKVRFEEGSPGSATLSGFDGTQHWSNKASVVRADEALLETVLFNSFERLLFRQQAGQATRKIGSRFRVDGGASGAAYTGPVYDIYAVYDDLPGNGKSRQTWKWYYLNSNTLLLERIEYQGADGTTTTTLLEQWTQFGGDWVPRSIRRIENGKEVLRIEVAAASSAAIQPASFYSNAAGKP